MEHNAFIPPFWAPAGRRSTFEHAASEPRFARKRARRFALIGLLGSLGAPFGLFLLQAIARRHRPDIEFLITELSRDPRVYAYVTVSTALAFLFFGYGLGRVADKLGASAFTDPLTGLGNRRWFAARLQSEVARAARYGTPLSLLMIDMDGLKLVNDRLGHAAGDRALSAIASVLRQRSRSMDFAARIGGDEFALILPLTRATRASELASRIVRSLPSQGREVALSVSIGVADLENVAAPDAGALLRAADQAMYRAKAAGRGCTCVAGTADVQS